MVRSTLTILLTWILGICTLGQSSLTTPYNFRGVLGDGSHPIGDLALDSHGVLYGVTSTQGGGGAKIYQLIPPTFAGGAWTKVNIYAGKSPISQVRGNFSPLTLGNKGELYGVSLTCQPGLPHVGCIFQLTPPTSPGEAWTMTNLSFQNDFQFGDGRILPVAGKLAIDSNGNLYGVTHRHHHGTYGTIYQLSPPLTPGGAWTRNVLYDFQRFPLRGSFWEPQDGLAIDGIGALYGSTLRGRNVAFSLRLPQPQVVFGRSASSAAGHSSI